MLLVSGLALVLAALVMLQGLGLRTSFAGAGFVVELLGLGMLTQSYRAGMVQQRDESRADGGTA